MKIAPVTLEGLHVKLEPLSESHHEALCEVGFDPELWRLNPLRVTNADEMMAYIRQALDWQKAGTALPFATLGAMRVELKTDTLNKRSRNAMQRMGATQEGIFRNHMTTWSGRIRHSIYFSIIDAEWPRVKSRLEAKLASKETSALRRVDTLNETQIEDLLRLFQNEWWTKDRTMDDVRRMLDGTAIHVAFADASNDHLAAYARVLTDGTYKALILDVIVDPSRRESGLGKMLLDAVVSHPLLSGVRHFELYCKPELMPFYERFGFKEIGDGLRFMRRA